MPHQLPEHTLVTLLQQCLVSSRCQASRIRQRHLSTSTRSLHSDHSQYLQGHTSRYKAPRRSIHSHNEVEYKPISAVSSGVGQGNSYSVSEGHEANAQKEERFAVLGGGITGLTATYYLAKNFPNSKITLFEKSDRLGGWLQSKHVDVGNGSIVFEQGPRTLRPHGPNGLATLEIIAQLGLQDQMTVAWKDSVAAQNRFIYYPDRLVKMPGPGQGFYEILWNLLTEPVFKGFFPALLSDWNGPPRPSHIEDESVGAFLNRRFGSPDLANNLVSAVLHGIYAGDIYQLSMKSLMPKFWKIDGAVPGCFTKSRAKAMMGQPDFLHFRDTNLHHKLGLESLKWNMPGLKDMSVYSLKGGLEQLSTSLEAFLREQANVEIKLNQGITSLEFDNQSKDIKINTSENQPAQTFTKTLSTLPSSILSKITHSRLPTLAQTPSVTVQVVNLYYRDQFLLPERGFGYLIPRSIPFAQNPECALGVVFDSDTIGSQDTPGTEGTKVTIMFGGHWWDGFESYPDDTEALENAKAILKRHLKITNEPAASHVSLQKDCIPQYTVGHHDRMRRAHNDLWRVFEGKLAVAGNSYRGVGLNDCVRSARDVVSAWCEGGSRIEVTGLENFKDENEWVLGKVLRGREIGSEEEVEK